MKKSTLLFIGPLPPPNGGISIHIRRLSELLKNDFIIDFIDESSTPKPEYFNIRKLNLITYLKKVILSDIIYVHSGNHILRTFHMAAGFFLRRKVILTLHAYPFKKMWMMKRIEEFFYSTAKKIILVNPDLFDKLVLPKSRCIVQNAFLPPCITNEPELPAMVSDWVNSSRNSGNKIICANAWQLESFQQQDLYGVDLCIEAVNILRKRNYKIGMIFNVSSIDKFGEKYEQYQRQIIELGLQDVFLLCNVQMSFVRLIEMADIVLRPTNTDGDALTIREALYLGKTVLASDVVKRPDGTELFKNRDVADMADKMAVLLERNKSNCPGSSDESKIRYYDLYTNLVNSVLAGK